MVSNLKQVLRSTHHAAYNFNQSGLLLYNNQPRLPFEYYIDIKLNRVATAASFITDFFSSSEMQVLMPLVKTVEMPTIKIETSHLNQYNRKRISQSKISYEPVKMVFHDVADGKTLRFWEMYYRYYFADGNEPGKNTSKSASEQINTYSTESATTGRNPSVYQSNVTSSPAPWNTIGEKSMLNNIISDKLDNHSFGFNLPTIQNVRNLIQKIDIYQVHGGKFNQVTLVNPRIATFQHDTLNYAEGGKTLEMTFVFEYEYAYYTLQNLKLGGGEENNSSSLEPFEHGDYLELPGSQFNISTDLLTKSSNSSNITGSLQSVLPNIGSNIQDTLGNLINQYSVPATTRFPGTSSLDGLINMFPPSAQNSSPPILQSRPFEQSAQIVSQIGQAANTMYADVSRIRSIFGG